MQLSMMLAFMSISSCVSVLISMLFVERAGPISRSARKLYGRKWGVTLLLLGGLQFAGLWSVLNSNSLLLGFRQQLASAILLYMLVIAYLQVFQFWAACQGIRIGKFCIQMLALAFIKILTILSHLLQSGIKLLFRAFQIAIYQPATELTGLAPKDIGLWLVLLLLSCVPEIFWVLLGNYTYEPLCLPAIYVLTPVVIKLLKQPGCRHPAPNNPHLNEYDVCAGAVRSH